MTSQQEHKLKAIRDGFGEGLVLAGRQNPQVVAMSADLSESVKMEEFSKHFPERFIQIGIAEQNMAGVASGLALSGKIPFIGSFACFQPMRNLDQIRTSICIMNANVKIVSSHAGFSFAGDGVQIQALEDIAIMRALPNMRVLVPADAKQAAQMVEWMVGFDGPGYLRLGRAVTDQLSTSDLVDKEVYTEAEFGRGQMLRAGTDVVIFACGYMVQIALQAAADLKTDGIHASVINLHTIKPLDEEMIKQSAEIAQGRVIVVEEHQMNGGLGGAVAETLGRSGIPFKMKQIAVQDHFGDSAATHTQLWELYGLTPMAVVDAAKQLID